MITADQTEATKDCLLTWATAFSEVNKMTDNNYVITKEGNTLFVTHVLEYMASDGSIKKKETSYEATGNTEGLSSGDILKAENFGYCITMVKYLKDGKEEVKPVMNILSWEKVV